MQKTQHRNALSIFVLALSFAPSSLAEVHDVGGPNADFPQISDAVQAAQSGDMIRIYPGTYQGFTIDDKSLALFMAGTAGTISVTSDITIQNLRQEFSVEFADIEANSELNIQNCAGSVRVRDCSTQMADVSNSDDVALVDCVLQGGYYTFGSGFPGLRSANSNVSAYSCELLGGRNPWPEGGWGGSGAWCGGTGTVYFSGCALQGADGSTGDSCNVWVNQMGGPGGNGGDGLVVVNLSGSTPNAVILDCTIQPGQGGVGGDGGCFGNDPPGASGWPGMATVGPVSALPGTSKMMRADGQLPDQTDITLTFTGDPGDIATWHISAGPDYHFRPGLGPYLVQPHLLTPLQMWRIAGRLDATGTLTTTVPGVDLPHLSHEVPHFQGALHGTTVYFTPPAYTVILDSAW